MGHIAEPENVDFIIESPPLSDKERKEISDFIKKLKDKEKALRKVRSFSKLFFSGL
jgi:hypothetical protein